MSNWNRTYTRFCEYQLNGHPEVFNVITSFAIIFMSSWGLFMSKLQFNDYNRYKECNASYKRYQFL